MATFFRKQEISVKDKVVTIEQKSIEDIFKFNSQPYIIVGTSGCGKTTLCIDIIYKFSKMCTNIYYVTATSETITDDSLSQIPKAFRRKPTFENLYGIWKEITENHDAFYANETKLTNVLVTLCGQSEATNIINQLNAKRKAIQKEQQELYLSKNYNENDARECANNDSKAFYIDVLTKLILDLASTKGTKKLTIEDMNILSALVSPEPRVLLMLDDVSAELNDLRSKQQKVVYNGQQAKISDAYKNLIIDILTRGRHYGVLVCIFLHTIDLINDKSLINNLVVLNKGAAQKINNFRTFTEDMKAAMLAATQYIFTDDHNHLFLYISQSDDTLSVGRADLHYGQDMELSKINQEFVNAYEAISSGIDAGAVANNVGDEGDYYSSGYTYSGDDGGNNVF